MSNNYQSLDDVPLKNVTNVEDEETANDSSYIFFKRNETSMRKEKDDNDIASKVGKFISRYNCTVIIFWLVALFSTAYFATQLLTNTQLAFTPPYSSPAAISHRKFEKLCPVQANISNVLILAYANDDSGDVTKNKEIEEFSFNLNKTLTEEYGDYIYGVESYYLLKAQTGVPDFLYNEFLQHNKDGTVATKPTSTIILVAIKDSETSQSSIRFANQLRDKMHQMTSKYTTSEYSLSGLPAMYKNIIASTIESLETMDAIVVPFAMLILGIMIRSFRLLAVSLTSLTVAFSLTFAIVDFYAVGGLQILTATPSLMGSILLAMSIDYSLFFLTRLQVELTMIRLDNHFQSQDPYVSLDRIELETAIIKVLRSSGKIILASGITLTICFLGLMILPLNLIQTIGVGCATALIFTMAVTLTLLPAMIFKFPNFFTKSCLPASNQNLRGSSLSLRSKSFSELLREEGDLFQGKDSSKSNNINDPEMPVLSDIKASPGGNGGNGFKDGDQVALNRLLQSHKSTLWYQVGLITQTRIGSIIILLICACCVYLPGKEAFNPTLSTTLTGFLPRGGESTKTLARLEQDFAPGTAYPFSLFIEVDDVKRYGGSDSVISIEFISTIQNLLAKWQKEVDNVNNAKMQDGLFPALTQIQSIMLKEFGGIPVEPSSIRDGILHNCSKTDLVCTLAQPLLSKFAKEFLNHDRTVTIIEIELGIPPFGSEARKWIDSFRKVMDEQASTLGLKMYLSGFGCDVSDSVKGVYAAWPLMISIISVIVLITVGLSFRSVILALRGIITIAITILFVQGMAKITYCDNYFEFVGLAGLTPTSDPGLIWLVPPVTFPILVGIALDYDIFFVGRVVEFKESGLSTRKSILAGMVETGTIITAAGVIQALAFFGLLLGDIPVLNQLSFYLLCGVLFDTFIVRTLVVPSVMFWIGSYNFS